MYEQENRLLNFYTPLGKDELLLTGFHGKEGLSELFTFELDLISERHNISFNDILGKQVCISITLAEETNKRFIHGIISNFSHVGGDKNNADFSLYTATMVPWFWLLTRTADSRKFLDHTIPEIIEIVFSEYDFTEYSFRLHGSYEIREYTVQYRETDFNFISRLLEENGIYYFFDHSEEKHTMVLADSPTEHKPCPEQESARYMITRASEENEDYIVDLEIMKEIRAGKYTLNDYNFKVPNAALEAIVLSKYKMKPGEREIYDYPGEYTNHSDGEGLANIRMEEEEARITTITGSSTCRSFVSGFRFSLEDYFREEMNNKEFVLIHIEHMASQQPFQTGSTIGGDSETSYTNKFNCIPFEIP
ncbi:MAG: type VI secretion system tip protein VgrG, partial [Desulfobacula sp.]|nr:type VI secretion system tip protein VgrG [Desulfobacula sp.]